MQTFCKLFANFLLKSMPRKSSQYGKEGKEGKDNKDDVKQQIHHTQLPKHFKHYPLDKSSEPWGEKAPLTTTQRRELMAKCGPSCFLDPKELKFPICNKISKISQKSKKEEDTCEYNQRAIKRAVPSRAGQWKYVDITNFLEKSSQKRFGM